MTPLNHLDKCLPCTLMRWIGPSTSNHINKGSRTDIMNITCICYIHCPSEPKARNFAHYYTRSQTCTCWSKSCQTDYLTTFKRLIKQFLFGTSTTTTPMPSKTFSDQIKQMYIIEELNFLFAMHFIMGLRKPSLVVPPLLHSSSTKPFHPFLPQLLERTDAEERQALATQANTWGELSVEGKGHCKERGIVQKQAGPSHAVVCFPPPKHLQPA